MGKNKVAEVQEHLHQKGIDVSEVAIINAAIRIATRWGGNHVFVCEFRKQMEGMENDEIKRG